MAEIDVMINMGGNLSQKMREVSQTTRKYKNDMDGLQKRLDEFHKMQAKLETSMKKAEKEAKNAAKEYESFGDEISRVKSETANFKLQGMKDEFEAVSKAAKQTKREMENLNNQSNKIKNRGLPSGKSCIDTAKNIVLAQGFDTIIQTGAEAAIYGITSVFGQENGNLWGGAISGAISGVGAGLAIGTKIGALGGPMGAALGAGIGAITGLVSGGIQNAQNKDDFYKGIVQDRYSQSQQDRAQSLEAGSATAAGRELDAIAFKKLIGDGSEEYLEWVKKTGAETPFEYSDLTSLSKTMATYGYSSDEMKDLLIKIGDTGANLGLDASGMSMLATGLGRMKSSNKTTLEYLNLLLERGVPVIDYLSEGLGKSKGEIYDMVSKGLIPGSEAASIIAEKMGADNFGAMDEMSKTFSGLMSNMEDFWTNMDAAQGEGFNSARVPFLEGQTKWAENVSEEMSLGKQIVGEIEAADKNLREAALQLKYDEIFNSKEFKKVQQLSKLTELDETQMKQLEEAKRTVAEKMATVEAEAEAEYMKTEGAKIRQKSELDIINTIQGAVGDAWYQYGYAIQQEVNRGRKDAATGAEADNPYLKTAPNSYGNIQGGIIDFVSGLFHGFSGNAFGLTSVPYDNFPAMLHQGEAVLTASQARGWREGKGGGDVVISGNHFVVREEADIIKIAEALLSGLQGAKEGYIGT